MLHTCVTEDSGRVNKGSYMSVRILLNLLNEMKIKR